MALYKKKHIKINKKTTVSSSLLHLAALCYLKSKKEGPGRERSHKDCRLQEEENRLGWMGKHARHVKALGPFVLILSNADFLWVAEVAKSARVYVSVYVCVYSMCACVCVCV